MADALVQAYRASRNRPTAAAIQPNANSNVADIMAAARAINLSAPVAQASTPAPPKDWWETTMESLGHAMEQPVIKQIVDLISAPGAAVTGSLHNIERRMQEASTAGRARGEIGINNIPNTVQTAVEGLNPVSFVTDILGGLGQGAQLGLTGNREVVHYGQDVIKQGQQFNGIDTNSSESKWVQGLGGFGLDVALDPLNAVTALGKGAAGISGGVRGATRFRSENYLARQGLDTAVGTETTRWANAKKQAAVDVNKYKEGIALSQQAKEVRKKTRNLDANQTADFFIENISSLKQAVARAMMEDPDVAAKVGEKLSTDTADAAKVKEALSKLLDDTAPVDNTVDNTVTPVDGAIVAPEVTPKSRPLQPVVKLSDFKPPTEAEILFHKLADIRTTNKTPVYGTDTLNAVNAARTMRPDTIEKTITDAAPVDPSLPAQVQDIKATIKNLQDFDKEMGGNATIPVVGADGKKHPFAIKDLIPTLHPSDELFQTNWDAIKEFQVYKKPEVAAPITRTETVKNPKALTDEDFIKLGISPEHVALIRNGVKLEDITNDISVGDIRAITKNIRNGAVPDSVVKTFYEVSGTTDRTGVADYITRISKLPEFTKARDELKKYGSVRTGETPNPLLGVSGHGKLAREMPLKGITTDDLLSSKTAANPEQIRAFNEAKYTEAALNLASHPDGIKLRALADEAFEGTIDTQRRPAGPLTMRGGASANTARTKAKYEKLYNTHSGMWRMKHIIETVRTYDYSHRGLMDDAIMTTLADVDARLRLAGFDQHLSNMQIAGDKLVVRLSPSDALSVFTRTQRIQYLWGNKKWQGVLSEFLPTTLLDLAEVGVRSATKLTAAGKLDEVALLNNITYTLLGKYSEKATGKRVILNNLDEFSRMKNDQQILAHLDEMNKGNSAFESLYKKATTPKIRQGVIDDAMRLYPDTFQKLAKARLVGIPNDLFEILTKGLTEGKPGPLNELIYLNMRNASLAGGNVAHKVGQALAEHSAKVLDTLETGSLGEHLSALVSKPPFPTTDAAIKAVLEENTRIIQHSVATPEEVRHAKALNKNVEATKVKTKPASPQRAAAQKAGSKVNREAYQKSPVNAAQMAQPLNKINTDHVFDEAVREANKDKLYRLFGTLRFFNRRTGMPLSFDVIAGSTHSSNLLMTGFHEILRELVIKGYSDEDLRVAFNALKQGGPVDEITTELNSVLQAMFSADNTNFLSRNSVGPKHFNDVLEAVHFDTQFRVAEDATPEEMMNAWKKWDVTKVKDFFSKMMGAMVKTAEDVSMGASFSAHFGKEVWEKGYSKVIDTTRNAKDANPFIPLIDQTLYYPDEVLGEVVHIGRLMRESRSFKPGTAHHTFITKVFDPVISTLKLTQTTMKPGHHVMSITGDVWRNSLALSTIGVINPATVTKLYWDSANILWASVGKINELEGFQKFTRSQKIANEIALSGDKQKGSLFFANIGGGGKVGLQNLYALMQARGVALPGHLSGIQEDMLTDFATMSLGEKSTSKVINTVGKVTSGIDRLANPIKPKFGKDISLNKFTAHRDTWTRGALFLGAMRSRNFATVEEAVNFAASFVRKWSPTAADLGAVESKYLRRAIFYYTWIRGMVPRIIEAGLMRPGVAILPNRAMYNLAAANGLDPNSVGDPFPPGTLMPSWYSERVIGPQWKSGNGDLWGGNPTGPFGDVLNQFGSNIAPKDFLTGAAVSKTWGTFLNMSTPWFKAPAELLSGKTLETGAPIDDGAQYLQDYIGPNRFFSRATGKDLYPAIGPNGLGMPNRTEAKYRKGLSPQQTLDNAIPEFVNYMLGLGLTNYTSDSAEKTAQFQAKDKLVQAKKQAGRFQ